MQTLAPLECSLNFRHHQKLTTYNDDDPAVVYDQRVRYANATIAPFDDGMNNMVVWFLGAEGGSSLLILYCAQMVRPTISSEGFFPNN